MIRLSASGAPRALACPASLVYPQHRYDTKHAAAGTGRHADSEVAIDMGDEEDVLPARVIAMLEPDDVKATECAFAYDCATGTARELGYGRESYKNLSPFEIPGCLDLIIRSPRRIIVVDKKGYERVGPAESNEQTLTYALMVARAYGYDEVTVVIYYEIGGVDVAVLSALDLDGHAERLKALLVDVARAQVEPTKFLAMGRWCKYCPAFLSCPKQHALTLEVGSGNMAMQIESRIPFDDDEDAAKAFDLLQRVKMIAARIQAGLYARAGQRPIPLLNGNVLGPIEKQGNERLDGDIVYQVIRDQHGQGIADAAVERKATKKRIGEALVFAGSKGERAKLERAVLDEVRNRGGAKREAKTVIEEYEPQALLTASK